MNSSADQATDRSDNSLDVEFREILCLIKNSIQHVTSNYYLSQYKAWLEKVNDAGETEKAARNVYLRELSKQIQQNRLSAPFNQAPPSGPLKIQHILNNVLPKLSESYEYIHNSNEEILWPYNEADMTDSSVYSHYSAPSTHYFGESPNEPIMWSDVAIANVKHSSMGNLTQIGKRGTWESEQKSRNKDSETKLNTKKSRRSKFRKLGDIDHVDFCEGLNELNEMEIPTVQSVRGNKFRNCNNCKFKPNTENISSIREDSSWCDLTDVESVIVLEGSGDAEKLLKTDTHQEIVQKVDENKDASVYKDNSTNNSNNVSTVVNVEERQRSASTERASMTLSNIVETKFSLKDTNFISEDWKKTIEGLQLRLTETVNQNNELKSVVQNLQNRIECDTVKYHEDLQRNLRQTESKYLNEIKSLKKMHAEKIATMQKSFETKMESAEQDFQQKNASMAENYEMRIRECRHDHENCLQSKDIEIKKLTDLIDSQCERTISAIAELKGQIATCKLGEEKQHVLEKCVSKMDKVFQKSEKEYIRQIEKLKQELDLKDKAMQVHLSSQKAEILARTSAVKQKEFDDIINDLEVKYIKMLEQHENQTMATRQKDNARIERLINVLSQYNIPYDFR